MNDYNRGIGQGGQGRGKGGGPKSGGPGGFCVCRRCGHRIPHERGRPCNEVKCPHCGAPMDRD